MPVYNYTTLDDPFATRSPTAIRNIRQLRPRREQIPETSRSGTSTKRRTRNRFLFDLPFSTTGEGHWTDKLH